MNTRRSLVTADLYDVADAGVTFFDTADVYGDGRSGRLIGQLLCDAGGDRWCLPAVHRTVSAPALVAG